MKNILHGSWISASDYPLTEAAVLRKDFDTANVVRAELYITSLGVYEAHLNGQRVGEFRMAPGWTSYKNRLQVQCYDVTGLLSENNRLDVTLARGWYGSRLAWNKQHPGGKRLALLATLRLYDSQANVRDIVTDGSWTWAKSPVLFSEIYDGETVDHRVVPENFMPVETIVHPKDILIAQEGPEVRTQEELPGLSLIRTPKGETVIDFGQEVTGVVRFTVRGKAGHVVTMKHAEVLDAEGNFYTANLRSAKATFTGILKEGENHFETRFTFYGFRYIQLIDWPEEANLADFTAVVLHSDMKRTGWFDCGSEMVNKLYSNIIWGQKGNYLDVPTDCPQRDERLGWTGDAQVFTKAAAYNFDVKDFFTKWLHDLKADQFPDGGIPDVVPDVLSRPGSRQGYSPAWQEAATVCPWQMYETYGDAQILAEQFDSMQKLVDHLRGIIEYDGGIWAEWRSGFADWLGLDAPYGSYRGSTPKALIGTAMYLLSTDRLIKAGKALGKDMSKYEDDYAKTRQAFMDTFLADGDFALPTQTSYVLALYLHLCDNPAELAAKLANLIRESGAHLTTGFVGTPYLLHALSENGYTELAYDLLLQDTFPSWLFSVRMGATTIWEHWDGINAEGQMWATDMNSFNHYAYGAVADWMYGVAGGVTPAAPGYAKVRIAPQPDARLGHADVTFDSVQGRIRSAWKYVDGACRYEIELPKGLEAEIVIDGETHLVTGGTHRF